MTPAGVPLEGSLEGQVRHWVQTKARGDGMPIDWGRLAHPTIEPLVIE